MALSFVSSVLGPSVLAGPGSHRWTRRKPLDAKGPCNVNWGMALATISLAAHRGTTTRRAMRSGDVGEKGAEAFFPEGDTEESAKSQIPVTTEPPMRIGHGYDIHRMLPRDEPEGWGKCTPQPAVIGGVTFEDFPLGVVAHSDGDVVYHSTTDAILGALGLPDIGQLFPDNDPRWRGANSEQFFDEAVRLMRLRGYRIGNIDVTIIAEKPRLAAKKQDMKDNLVRICDTIPARVNLKARTHEKLDSVGQCQALKQRPVQRMTRGRGWRWLFLLSLFGGCAFLDLCQVSHRKWRPFGCLRVRERGRLGGGGRAESSQTQRLADYSGQAARMFDNMRAPAALLAGGIVPLGFFAAPKIEPTDSVAHKWVKRIHYLVASIGICCELIAVVWSTMKAVGRRLSTAEVLGSTWGPLDQLQSTFDEVLVRVVLSDPILQGLGYCSAEPTWIFFEFGCLKCCATLGRLFQTNADTFAALLRLELSQRPSGV
eukprot:symbB.v1.2.012682.t1/scaffold880.1/size155533/4